MELKEQIPRFQTRFPIGSRRSHFFQKSEWIGDGIFKAYQSLVIRGSAPNEELKVWNVKCLLGPKLIQAIRELIECNETHVWVYDICQFSRLYPEHQNFGDGGKADFVEAAMCYIYNNGGEAEVIRLFQGLWRALVRLAVGTYRRVPTYLRFSKT